ncbi:transglutaminase-like cysteine peptidase [Parvibaculum sp.]|uniref:transglutaminase-like cysteine peptidase n=1 Tax=Parvibaculum sp. TaxID=2024848 RepID=UPI002C4D4D58|nr:transglutaminase-like cysteine peptidase [Parvibaculum sp.]HUD53146.1 transglutaminase-like cysteine peptidase [Parvibaculum sp.]
MYSLCLFRRLAALAFALALAACASIVPDVETAARTPAPPALSIPAGPRIVPPVGYIDYCLRHAEDCGGGTDRPAAIDLTPARWFSLLSVNDAVNRLPQIADIVHYRRREYWTLPDARGGDCEDLVLLKRKLLVQRGWPMDALLLATALDPSGEGHALLIVATRKGDLVLDSRSAKILPWSATPYRWKARQSRERPYVWVALDRATSSPAPEPALPPVGAPAPFLAAAERVRLRNAAVTSMMPQAPARQAPLRQAEVPLVLASETRTPPASSPSVTASDSSAGTWWTSSP